MQVFGQVPGSRVLPCRRVGGLRWGLTIVELIVSVVVVSLCASVVLSAVGDLRRGSKEVRCLHNLGRIASASAVYSAGDEREAAVPVHPRFAEHDLSRTMRHGELTWGGRSGKGELHLDRPILDSVFGTRNGRGPGTRPLNRIIYKRGFPDFGVADEASEEAAIAQARLDLDVFRCPGDIGFTSCHSYGWRDSGLTSYDHYGNSYAANSFKVASLQMVAGQPQMSPVYEVGPFLQPVSRIVNPTRTYLYVENVGAFAWRRAGATSSIYGIYITSTISFPFPSIESLLAPQGSWHGQPQVFNTAFADGHVRRTAIDDRQVPDPRSFDNGRYPQEGLFGFRPEIAYAPLLFRGDDWQVDNLPGEASQDTGRCTLHCIEPLSWQANRDEAHKMILIGQDKRRARGSLRSPRPFWLRGLGVY